MALAVGTKWNIEVVKSVEGGFLACTSGYDVSRPVFIADGSYTLRNGGNFDAKVLKVSQCIYGRIIEGLDPSGKFPTVKVISLGHVYLPGPLQLERNVTPEAEELARPVVATAARVVTAVAPRPRPSDAFQWRARPAAAAAVALPKPLPPPVEKLVPKVKACYHAVVSDVRVSRILAIVQFAGKNQFTVFIPPKDVSKLADGSKFPHSSLTNGTRIQVIVTGLAPRLGYHPSAKVFTVTAS